MNLKKTSADGVIKTSPFNIKYTLECGQCFRWKKIDQNIDNTYIGVIQDRVIKVAQDGDTLYIFSNNTDDLEKIVRRYFDLNTNYLEIENQISKIDQNIQRAVKNTTGIHILNQSNFETLISYIISANNNIPRISKSINCISEKYGRKVEFENSIYYLFPTPEALKDVSEDDFKKCGVGFRARYIKHTVDDILSGKVNLAELQKLRSEDAKKILLSLMGVGSKVADCLLLFSYSRKEVFPIDVWIKRVMENIYFKKAVSIKEIEKYATQNFGKYAGIVQQHLFYNIRENMI